MTDPQPRSSLPEGLRPTTLAIRGGQERTGFMETAEPLFLTQGYVYPRAADAEATFLAQLDRFSYTRYANPTTSAFEERLRLIEGAEACFATATGMAAVFASMACLVRQGSRIVAGRAMFGSTLLVLDELFKGWGIETVYVDAHDNDQWAAALATPADVVFFETPTNPMQDIVDIVTVSELAHRAGALVVVDNVFATPVLQKPLALGADVVVYSTTKHIDGQGRVLGGAVLGPREYVLGPLQTFLRNTGPTMSPFNAWVLLKSLETMDLRVRRQSENSLEIARWLEAQPGVVDVRYPYLPSHPQHELAVAQQEAGGTVVSFTLDGPTDPDGGKARAFAFLDALRLIDISNNLGDVKSLVTHPATTTHMKSGFEGRQRVGIGESTIRLSVGLEDPADLVDDLARGLAAPF
ncbi:O-succinylhomoserine sulfhydrylase [Salana multivorans]|uniref:O-succinylhomoserine sulfhydrylase n=1 Tax=Salana multivorans TaxID=120377 RepID=A0A3N2D8Z7_9MICO|nr:O-succinylhomoserine sulfhydrylase [Salana multivorans]MBN8882298.1 O-succinylhomoserine sulfhydrylase [Salana multivorans]OJX97391.1 MAG: O-succinylhomoserine sulfhydrylase [Micrococcales bacterium 73-15]ROR96263.1 O-succinylhomoserine sulfhydrylase [Salana multivorans]